MPEPARTAQAPANLYGLDREELTELLARHGDPPFHAGQIYRWLYARRRREPDTWTDLPRALREWLARTAVVEAGRLDARTVASDGTIKYRVSVARGGATEAVFMLQSGRVTLCVSSQIGCALACDFCLTGRMGLVRNLDAGEIVAQVALIQDDRDLCSRPFNVVFMGMGEPLHNYDAVLRAFRLLSDPAGFGLSPRRITVSTAGLVPAIERLAAEPRRPRLAISLNATTDELRNRLMPVNRRWPLARLFEAAERYRRAGRERVTFEYVLLDGVNDRPEDVRRLGEILRRHPFKLNLIPHNAVPGRLPYRPPPRGRVIAIRDELLAAGLPVSVRWSRGREAQAACGQLALLPDTPVVS